jgi:hypothetical protein
MFGCDFKTGGESGIRTHVTLSSKHAFQACAFSHSAISPAKIASQTNCKGVIPTPVEGARHPVVSIHSMGLS